MGAKILCCGQRRTSYHMEVNLFHSRLALHSSWNLKKTMQSDLHDAPAGEQWFRCSEECCSRLLQKLSPAS